MNCIKYAALGAGIAIGITVAIFGIGAVAWGFSLLWALTGVPQKVASTAGLFSMFVFLGAVGGIIQCRMGH